MRKSTKKTSFWRVLAISLAFILALPTGYYVFRQFVPPTKTNEILSDYASNPYIVAERVSFAPYAFVGYVEKTYDMNQARLYRSFPASRTEDFACNAYTECVIKVLKNIKGDLRTDVPISYYKPGGLEPTLSALIKHRDDVIPEEGKLYVFLANASEDSTFGGGGPNSTVELEQGITAETLEKSEIYQEFVEGCKNPVLNDWAHTYLAYVPRYMSEFDVNFKENGQLLPDSPSLETYAKWQAEKDREWAEGEAEREAQFERDKRELEEESKRAAEIDPTVQGPTRAGQPGVDVNDYE
ncbi:MAG: hypothetical protein FWG82_00075 [Oscillospiraceae bacterium]|nr:hypothetical protein [Oscillospiraceae bacterium]